MRHLYQISSGIADQWLRLLERKQGRQDQDAKAFLDRLQALRIDDLGNHARIEVPPAAPWVLRGSAEYLTQRVTIANSDVPGQLHQIPPVQRDVFADGTDLLEMATATRAGTRVRIPGECAQAGSTTEEYRAVLLYVRIVVIGAAQHLSGILESSRSAEH